MKTMTLGELRAALGDGADDLPLFLDTGPTTVPVVASMVHRVNSGDVPPLPLAFISLYGMEWRDE